MLNLLSSEIFRMRKRAQSWILFVIATLLIGLIYGGFVLAGLLTSGQESQDLREQATFTNFSEFGISMAVGFFGSVMLIIIAAGSMGSEFSWNTLRPLVARARSRVSLLTAKLLSVLIYTVLFVVLLTLVVAAMFLIGSQVVGEPSGFSMGVLGDGFEYAAKLTYTNLPYIALAFMLATVFKSNAAGIAGALGLSFIEQPIFLLLGMASSFFEKIEKWGISYNVAEISGFDGADINTAGIDYRAAAILAVYTAIFVAISYIVFLRRDVTSG